jgi:dienelactone hydrolase
MSITTNPVEYEHEGQSFEGLLVEPGDESTPRPVVFVLHDWQGRSAGQEGFARRLTAWGYASFAVDLYGKGKRGTTTEECQALMMPLMQDRALLRRRLLNVVEVVRQRPEIESANMAAIGFCFGGLCALDLARAGAPLNGVASFHGLFTPPGLPIAHPFQSKVIAFHGWEDPFAPPDQILAFGKEFSDAGADWQLHAYGATKHGFMNESANNPAMGIVYQAETARRAWTELQAFLAEILGAPRAA